MQTGQSNKAISVIIVSRNRQQKLAECLRAIHQNTFTNFELIVVDQSDVEEIHSSVQRQLHKFSKVIYLHSQQIGLSKGRNLAIKKSSAPILAFTDDDCVPDKYWLINLLRAFQKFPDIAGVFGRSIPYKPERHEGLICPAIFNKTSAMHVTKPFEHWTYIGFGNNMAYRRTIFETLGGFAIWLGSGSIGCSAEDLEMALRCLIKRQVLHYEPESIIRHNRWLTATQYKKQNLTYERGTTACYIYYSLLGHSFAASITKDIIADSRHEIRNTIRSAAHMRPETLTLLLWFVAITFTRLCAIFIAYLLFLANTYFSTSKASNRE